MALVQRELEVRVLVETDEENMVRTLNFVKTSLKGSCRNLKNGSVAIGLYDDRGRVVGVDVTGTPSPVMQNRIEELFDEEEQA